MYPQVLGLSFRNACLFRAIATVTLGAALWASSASAALITFTNTAGGKWNDAANWNPNTIPGSNDDVVIAAGAGCTGLGATQTCLSLSVAGIFQFDLNQQLTVIGGTIVSNGGTVSLPLALGITRNFNDVTVQSGGAFQTIGGGRCTVYGNITNDGTWNFATGTLILTGTNKVISGSAPVTVNTAAMSGTYTVQTNMLFGITGSLSGAGSLTNQGILYYQGTGTPSISNLDCGTVGNAFIWTNTSPSAFTPPAMPYYDLIVGGLAPATLNLNSAGLAVRHDLTVVGATTISSWPSPSVMGKVMLAGNPVVIGAFGVLTNVLVASNATVAATNAFISAPGSWVVTNGGTFNVSLLSGSGAFTLRAGATLGVTSSEGLSSTAGHGSIQVFGARSFQNFASYTYYSAGVAQVTGSQLNSNINTLTISNTLGVTLTLGVGVTNRLLVNGLLDTGGQTLSLGTAGAVYNSGTIKGSLTLGAGSKVYAGTDGGLAVAAFQGNLAMVTGSSLNLDVGTTRGATDFISVSNTLTLNNTVINLTATDPAGSLDTSADYTLITAGSVSGTPVLNWVVPPVNANGFSLVTTAGAINLHYGAVTNGGGSLVFSNQPSDTTVGSFITPPVRVIVRNGNGVPVFGVNVTLSISNGATGLGGTTVQTSDSGGFATFSDLSVSQTGTYNLVALAPGVGATNYSAVFSITNAPVSGTGPLNFSSGSPYTQDFNTLASNGTTNAWLDDVTLSGWYAAKAGGTAGNGPITIYRAISGTDNTGAMDSYGVTGVNSSSDRALGSLDSNATGNQAYGARFFNDTGSAVSNIVVSYTGEQWRCNGNTAVQKLTFSYRISDSGITSPDPANSNLWTSIPVLDFASLQNFGSGFALDGNAVTNRSILSATLSGVVVLTNQEIFFRWVDANDTGNDHGLAMDDLSISWASASNGNSQVSGGVTLNNLSQTYDGTARVVTASTVPTGLSVAFTYNGLSSAPTNAGSYTVIGTITDASYFGSATNTLVVGKASQTITFGALATHTNGDAPFTLMGTASSGLLVSYTNSNTAVATINGSTVTTVGTGSAMITAQQFGDSNYFAAATVSQTLTVVTAVPQVLTGPVYNPTNGHCYYLLATNTWTASEAQAQVLGGHLATINDATKQSWVFSQFAVSSGSNNLWIGLNDVAAAGIFVWTSGETSSYANWAFTEPNNYAGNEKYVCMLGLASSQAGRWNDSDDFASPLADGNNAAYGCGVVELTSCGGTSNATVTLTNLSQTYNGTARVVTATTVPAGLTVNLTYNGSSAVPTNAGSYPVVGTITDANYFGSATNTLVVGKASQTITFGALATHTNGDAPFALTGTASSGLPVSYTSSNTAVATVSGSTLTITGAGSSLISATQSGNSNYLAAAPVSQSLTVVGVVANTLLGPIYNPTNGHCYYLLATNTWTASEAQAQALGGHLATINDAAEQSWVFNQFAVSSGSNNLWIGLNDAATTGIFVWTSGETSSYANWAFTEPNNYAGNEKYVYMLGLASSQAGRWNDSDNFASPLADGNNAAYGCGVVEVISCGTFSNAVVTLTNLSQTYNGAARVVTASTVPAGLTVNLTYNGSSTAPTNAGSYTVVGMVADPVYQGSATSTLVVAKAAASVTLSNLAQVYTGAPRIVTASTVPAGLTVNLTYNGSAIAPTNSGAYTVVGTVTNANYTGGATNFLAVGKASQTITFGALATHTNGDTPFVLTATASSGLPVSFTSSNLSVATISGSTVTTVGAGFTTITAQQFGNFNYLAATPVLRTLTVVAAVPQILTGPVYNPTSGHCYYLLATNTWTASEAQAQVLGGHLATINDATEQSWVFNQFAVSSGSNNLWIGLSDVVAEGTYVWASGESPVYVNWASGEPNNYAGNEDYVYMLGLANGPAGHWNDSDNFASPLADGNNAAYACGVVEVTNCLGAPTIVTQPSNVVVVVGSPASFSVGASGTLLSYQWANFNGAIAGATNSNYSIPATTLADGGNYFVVVSNAAGFVASSNVSLTVNCTAPAITSQPADSTNLAGTTAFLFVTATGNPLYYQWRLNGGSMAGQTNATLVIDSVPTNDQAYDVVVYSPCGSVTSRLATLTPVYYPAFVTQPVSRTNGLGSTATFSAVVSGNLISYQWQFNSNNLVDGGQISGATSPTLTISGFAGVNVGAYRLVATNYLGTAISVVATLSLSNPTFIVLQPSDQVLPYGSNAVYKVAASGPAPLTYRWQKNGIDLVNGGNIAGANTTRLTVSGVTRGDVGSYTAIVSNVFGQLSSSAATLTIIPTVVIISPAANVKLNDQSLTVTGTAGDLGAVPGHEGIATVYYRLNGSSNQVASGTTNWSATVTLAGGTNVFEVFAVNNDGLLSATASRAYFFPVLETLSLTINGSGTVSPNLGGQKLYVGRRYTMTASPRANNLFSNWTGSVSSSSKSLNFLMQSNLAIVANFSTNAFLSLTGRYVGLFYQTNGSVGLDSSGMFYFVVQNSGHYLGRLLINGVNEKLEGQFDVGGVDQLPVFGDNNGTVLGMTMALDISPNSTHQVTGMVASTNNGWVAPLFGERRAYGSAGTPVPQAGKYTAALVGDSDGSLTPGGDGIATLKIAVDGTASWSGVSPDQNPFSYLGWVTESGRCPIYVKRNSGAGALFGWTAFNGQPVTNISGDLIWIRKAGAPGAGSRYPSGFTNEFTVLGSPINSPLAASHPALSITNGRVLLSGANLLMTLTNAAVYQSSNAITIFPNPNLVALKVKTTGLVSGSFLNPGNGTSSSIYGVILPGDNTAHGFFTTPTQSGSFLLTQ